MLWTLYDRVHEARRPGSGLTDPEAARILRAIDYDFRGRFGLPTGAIGLRALAFDEVVRAFVQTEPSPVVVSLGEGLETQRFRIPGDRLWITIDLPESMDVRERFVQPDARHWHIRGSATDPAVWARVPTGRPTIVTAQGLFMYLPPRAIRELVAGIAQRDFLGSCSSIGEDAPGTSPLRGARLVFDVIPRWAARATQIGVPLSLRYRLPAMPFGLDRHEVQRVLAEWVPGTVTHEHPVPFTWSPFRIGYGVARRVPGLSGRVPVVVVADLPRGYSAA